jgi:hypothetical protein
MQCFIYGGRSHKLLFQQQQQQKKKKKKKKRRRRKEEKKAMVFMYIIFRNIYNILIIYLVT